MIDWNALVGLPLLGVFGQPVRYQPGPRSPLVALGAFRVDGIFHKAYTPVDLGDNPSAISTRPALGIQTPQFPAGYDPEAAQGDMFTLLDPSTLLPIPGEVYVVKSGKVDGMGHALLEANKV